MVKLGVMHVRDINGSKISSLVGNNLWVRMGYGMRRRRSKLTMTTKVMMPW